MEKHGSAVILAGGNSRRMGFDKQFIKLTGEYLIKEIAKKLFDHFDEVIIVSNNPRIREIGLDERILVYEDIIRDCGPLGGIYTGLKKASSEMVYITACDMPHVNGEYINYMKSQIRAETDGLVTRFKEWIEPMNAFYKKDKCDDIKDYLSSGKRNIYGFVKNHNFDYIEEETARSFSQKWQMFDNLNALEDLVIEKDY